MDKLDNIKKEVFLRRPVLQEIYNTYGQQSLKDYVQKSWGIPQAVPDALFLGILKNELTSLYGQEVAGKVTSQINKKPLVSTIDHHGIWGHPIFVNSDLIYSLHFNAGEFALALSTESVSLNNTSSWSGSALYHESGDLKRHSFFTDKLKTLPVLSTSAISSKDIDRFTKIAGARFGDLIEALDFKNIISESLPVATKQSFSHQASLLTFAFWQKVFPSAPKLLYVPLESLILKYLLKIFESEDSFLSKIILTQEGRGLWQKYFFTEHTFMFWGIDAKGRRQILSKMPNNSDIIRLIKEKKIYPSSPLCFAALLSAGIICAGGFTQTTWLTNTKEKLLMLLKDLGVVDAKIDAMQKIPTKNFAESSLAWLKIGQEYKTPSGVDLFFTGTDLYPKYLNLASNLSLEQSINLNIPTIYSVVVPKHEQMNGFNLEAEQKAVFDALNMADLLKDSGI